MVEAKAPEIGAESGSEAVTQGVDSPKECFPDRGDDPLADRIKRKMVLLISASCKLGGLASEAPARQVWALALTVTPWG